MIDSISSRITHAAIHQYLLRRLLINTVFTTMLLFARSGGISGTGGGQVTIHSTVYGLMAGVSITEIS
jgi:hypothetical protein